MTNKSHHNHSNKLSAKKSLKQILIRGASTSFILKIAGTGVAFLSEIFLARVMGETHYGIYAYVITWLNVLLLFSKLGCDNLLVKYVPVYQVQEEWSNLNGILRFSQYTTICASIITALITAVVIWLLRQTIDINLTYTFWIACLTLPLLTVTQLHRFIFQSFKHIFLTDFSHLILRPILFIFSIAVINFVFNQSVNSILAVSLNYFAIVIIIIFNIYWLERILPKQLQNFSSCYSYEEWIKFALALFLMSGMQLILSQTDIIMVGFFAGTTKAGIYSVVTRSTILITFALTAVNMVIAPIISELYTTGEIVKLQKILKLSSRGIFTYSVLVGCTLITFGNNILSFFGSGFRYGYYALLILVIGHLVNALSGSVALLMTMTGHQKQASLVLSSSALLNIILNAIFIPKFGINGAALATTITIAMWNVILLIYLRKNLNINPTII